MTSLPRRYLPIILFSLLANSLQSAQEPIATSSTTSSLIQHIDQYISKVLTENSSIDNYFNQQGQGKFASFCKENEFDNEAITEEIGAAQDDSLFKDLVSELDDFLPSHATTEKETFVINLVKKAYLSWLQPVKRSFFLGKCSFELISKKKNLYIDAQGNAYNFSDNNTIKCLHLQSKQLLQQEFPQCKFQYSFIQKGKCYLYMSTSKDQKCALYPCKISTDGKKINLFYDTPIMKSCPWLETKGSFYTCHDEKNDILYLFKKEQFYQLKDSGKIISETVAHRLLEQQNSSANKGLDLVRKENNDRINMLIIKNNAYQEMTFEPLAKLGTSMKNLLNDFQCLAFHWNGQDHLLWCCGQCSNGPDYNANSNYHFFMIELPSKNKKPSKDAYESKEDELSESKENEFFPLGSIKVSTIHALYLVPNNKSRKQIKLLTVDKNTQYPKKIRIYLLTLDLTSPSILLENQKPVEINLSDSDTIVDFPFFVKGNSPCFHITANKALFHTLTGSFFYIDLKEKDTLKQIKQREKELDQLVKHRKRGYQKTISDLYMACLGDNRIFIYYEIMPNGQDANPQANKAIFVHEAVISG
ncbi:MAG: hypothetical protein AAF335_01875 [Bacteroidota bacterium]